MTAADTNHRSVRELIDQHLQLLRDKRIDAWFDLWEEDGVFEFPFAPAGYPTRVAGRPAIRKYMAAFPEKLDIARFKDVQIHMTLDPQLAIVEFACEATAVQTGRPYNQRYICVVQARAGRFLLYRDYWNPLVAIDAFAGLDAFMGAFGTRTAVTK